MFNTYYCACRYLWTLLKIANLIRYYPIYNDFVKCIFAESY